jgi:hypothetical protein
MMVSIKRKWMAISATLLFLTGGFSLYRYSKSIAGTEPFIETEAELIRAECEIVRSSSAGKASSTIYGNPIVSYKYIVDGNQFVSDRVMRSNFYFFGSFGECTEFIETIKSKSKFLVYVDHLNPKLSFIDKADSSTKCTEIEIVRL